VDANAGGTEYVKTHNSIIVLGKIISKGTVEKPIRIISDSQNPTYTDWVGISVNNGEFQYTEIGYCLYGIYSTKNFEKLTIDNCYIHHNFATGVGFMNPKDFQTTPAWVKNSTISDCGHETIDTHSSGNLEIAYNFISKSSVGLNIRDDLNEISGHILKANIHHNIIIEVNKPLLIAGSADVYMTQCVLNSDQINSSRWQYKQFTMHQMDNPCAIFLEPKANLKLVLENSIIYDSPKGIWADDLGTQAVIQNGFLNFDNVNQPFSSNISPGAGILTTNSQFVNKSNGDFHLTSNSPCKGMGNPGSLIPNADIGAYGATSANVIIGWKP
jgi:hypothetical protein